MFTTREGDALPRSSLRYAFIGACATAGIARHMIKDCRHTFATLALRRGVHPKIV